MTDNKVFFGTNKKSSTQIDNVREAAAANRQDRRSDPFVSRRSNLNEPDIERTSNVLYHIKRTIHRRRLPSSEQGLYEYDICGSFTDYFSALEEAYRHDLLGHPHPASLKRIVKQHQFSSTDWTYGIECVVYAEAENGDLCTIDVEAELGKFGSQGDEQGRAHDPFWYVVRVEISRHAPYLSSNTLMPSWTCESRILSSWDSAKTADQCAAQMGYAMPEEDHVVHRVGEHSSRENVIVHTVDRKGTHVYIAVVDGTRDGAMNVLGRSQLVLMF